MKLLFTMGLSDGMLHYFIHPVSLLDLVEEIYIVRNKKGPSIEKVKYYYPPEWMLKIPALAALYKLFLLIKLSISQNISYIHSFLFFPHGFLALIAALLTRKKVGVSIIAGIRELYVFKGTSLGKYIYAKPLPSLNFEGKIIRMMLKQFYIITTTGSFTKTELVKKDILEEKITVLPHVVGKDFKRIDKIKEYDIVSIGRLSKEKHIEDVLHTIFIVKKTNPKIKVAILSIGPEKTRLEELSKQLDLTDNVVFAGFQENIHEWFNKGRIFILTSEREGFPFSIVEAMSCGLVVISSNCGDVKDIIRHNENGLLVNNYNDHQLYAKYIIELLDNDNKMVELGTNAINEIKKTTINDVLMTWKTILKKMENK